MKGGFICDDCRKEYKYFRSFVKHINHKHNDEWLKTRNPFLWKTPMIWKPMFRPVVLNANLSIGILVDA